MRRALLLLMLALVAATGHAHLLNMSKVVVTIDGSGNLSVDVQVDMTRAAGGSLEYYRLSRVPRPLQDPELKAIFGRLESSIALTLDREPVVGLHVVEAQLPALPESDFLSPVSWPMTHLRLTGSLPRAGGGRAGAASGRADAGGGKGAVEAGELRAVFRTDFRFEEPIALTFVLATEERSMTRWLVAGQAGPAFEVGSGAGLRSFASRPDQAGAGRDERDAAGGTATPGGRRGKPASDGAGAQSGVGSLRQFVVFGFSHILPKGLDHVLFVLGLYLGARSFKSLLLLVTCFTVAHSITLGMATLGIVHVPSNIVEPLIAASIVWVGIENSLSTRTVRYRPFIVFGFGLLHGLGFASALSELHLPRAGFLAALLSFNAGIELGQLCVIAIAMAVTLWFRNEAWYRSRVAVPASLLIAFIAGLWTVQRIWQ